MLTGSELTAYPVQTVPWGEWSAAHPDGLVLNRDTGHDQRHGQNPYVGYDEVGTDPFLLDVEVDDRLPAKEPVVGLGDGPDAVAVTTARLLRDRTVELELAGEPVVLFGKPGRPSARARRGSSTRRPARPGRCSGPPPETSSRDDGWSPCGTWTRSGSRGRSSSRTRR